jgi:hypothetical protein
MATLFGRNAILYVQGSGSAAELVSEATEFHISIDFESGDDGAFGDSWVTQLKGRMKWSGSLNGNLDTGVNLLFDAATATASRKIYLYPDRANMAAYYYGTAFPKLSVDVTLTAVAKFSGSIDGDGQLARN